MYFPDDLSCEAILDSLAEGVFTVDLERTITFFNHAAERITGIPREDAIGAKCRDVLKSELCDGNCAIQECQAIDAPVNNKSLFLVRADGAKVPVSISAAPLKNREGMLVGGVETFRDLTEVHLMRQQIQESSRSEDIVGKSRALGRIFQILPQIAKSAITVLILGESGTGKELFARAVHHLSDRSRGPFVAVNCGALPDTLLESELFGYKAGAFTDARRDKPGRFELAKGGTVFLDEIGDLPPKLQVKLLRVLQERVIEPLGGVHPVPTDVRVIAATNRDLDALVAEGSFRQDLYYRLNVATLRLPPLRERREDLPLLITHFVHRLAVLQGKDVQGVSEDVLALLMRHDFPGNVRELENILEFAFILCPRGFIQVEHLPEHLRPVSEGRPPDVDLSGTLEEIKRKAVLAALTRNRGRRMITCRELGISKDTLRRLLLRCGIPGAKRT